jgi:SAM-dependent methyltransferase
VIPDTAVTRDTQFFSDHERPGERERLALFEQRYDSGTIRRLEAIGVAHGWSCLEVGAGGGSIARWLAERVGRTGHVVATDLDTRFFEDAAASNFEAWRHDITTDPLPTAAFDVVHVRWLLDLLPERERCIEKLIAALKPGGWLLDEEPDVFPLARVPPGPYRKLVEALIAVMRATGVDSQWARTMPAVLAAAGLIDVQAEAEVDICRGGSATAAGRRLSFAQLREHVLKAGLLTDTEFDQGMADLTDASLWVMDVASVAAWGQKPTR